MWRFRSLALVVVIGGLFGSFAATATFGAGARHARYGQPTRHEQVYVIAPQPDPVRSTSPAGCPVHGAPIGCGHGAGCTCVPNARWFGYFPTLWRPWPCEPRPDKALPQAIGSELIPTPAGVEQLPLPVEEIETPAAKPPGDMQEPDASGLPAAPFHPQTSPQEPASPVEPRTPTMAPVPSPLPGQTLPAIPEKPAPGLPPMDLRAPAPFPPPALPPGPLEKTPDPRPLRAPTDSGQKSPTRTHIVPEPELPGVQVQLVAPANSGWKAARRLGASPQ